ncbi:hypothetical protein GF312_17225 [Candidatus Poribacteria bacterium]|nr:hypothetical protein [Candidatus Poribacteria bacterium]
MEQNYPNLMTPITFSNLTAPNRFVHQPMECDDSIDGFPSGRTLDRYRKLARGKAGITMVEAVSVGNNRARINQLMVDEEHRKGICELTKAFKNVNPDSLFIYQLNHAGQISGEFHRPDVRESQVVRVYKPKGFDNKPGKMLTVEDINEIIDAFIKGAEIVYDSGADGVDVKFCHGYLIGQITRPANDREWEYGGSLENRLRFPKRIIEGIKERITDPDFCLMVRISMDEGDAISSGETITGGVGTTGPESSEHSLDESLETLKMLADWGVDILNISTGIPAYNADTWVRPAKPPKTFDADDPTTYTQYHHLAYSLTAKKLDLGLPVVASGFSVFGKDIGKVGENAIREGYADLIGIGRQTLADPDIERILSGEANYCVRCRGCAKLLVGQVPVGCIKYDRESRERLKSL